MNSIAKAMLKRKYSFPVKYGEEGGRDLIRGWAERRGQPVNFETSPDYPAYWMNPRDMQAIVNAEGSPEELYSNPSYRPPKLDYPTSAINLDEGFTTLAKGRAADVFRRIREDRGLDPEVVYQHELTHYEDPRLDIENPKTLSPGQRIIFNEMLKEKQPLEVASREAPAVLAERIFKNRKFFKMLRNMNNPKRGGVVNVMGSPVNTSGYQDWNLEAS